MLMDQGTLTLKREKLIEAAGQVFAEMGFEGATVREICSRAGANVAAVNYHFGDKLGLYTEVLRSAMLARQAHVKDGHALVLSSDPKAALAALISQWFEQARESGRQSWLSRIMSHEMAQPTPALDRVVEAMEPNYRGFQSLVGQLIGRSPNDPRTRMCVHSVVGQVLQYVQSRAMVERLWPELNLNDEKQLHAIAEHIVEFSLAGMERVARSEAGRPRRRSK